MDLAELEILSNVVRSQGQSKLGFAAIEVTAMEREKLLTNDLPQFFNDCMSSILQQNVNITKPTT